MVKRNEYPRLLVLAIGLFLGQIVLGNQQIPNENTTAKESRGNIDSLMKVFQNRIIQSEADYAMTLDSISKSELALFYDKVLNAQDAWYNSYDWMLSIFALAITIVFGLAIWSLQRRRQEIRESVDWENKIKGWYEEVKDKTMAFSLAKEATEQNMKGHALAVENLFTNTNTNFENKVGKWLNEIEAVKNNLMAKLTSNYQNLELQLAGRQEQIDMSLAVNQRELNALKQEIAIDQENYKQETSLAYQYLIEDVLDSVRWITEDLLEVSEMINTETLANKKEFYDHHQRNIIEHSWIIQLYKYDADISRLTKPVQGLLGRGSIRCLNHLLYLIQRIDRRIDRSIVEEEKNELYKFKKLVKRAITEIQGRNIGRGTSES